jgi:manganese transport protein
MLPGMIIILIGYNPMKALVLSQVTLSFILPFAVIPMLLITSRKDIMGYFANKPAEKIFGWVIAAVIIAANAVLLFLTFSGKVA